MLLGGSRPICIINSKRIEGLDLYYRDTDLAQHIITADTGSIADDLDHDLSELWVFPFTTISVYKSAPPLFGRKSASKLTPEGPMSYLARDVTRYTV